MNNDIVAAPAIVPNFPLPQMPPLMFGAKCFSVSRSDLEMHLHNTTVGDYRLVYQLMSHRQIFSSEIFQRHRRRDDELKLHRLLLSIVNPQDEHVRSPQVIFTLIGNDRRHRLTQAMACPEGHALIFEWDRSETLRIETEAVVDGGFVTDHFVLENKKLLS